MSIKKTASRCAGLCSVDPRRDLCNHRQVHRSMWLFSLDIYGIFSLKVILFLSSTLVSLLYPFVVFGTSLGPSISHIASECSATGV